MLDMFQKVVGRTEQQYIWPNCYNYLRMCSAERQHYWKVIYFPKLTE